MLSGEPNAVRTELWKTVTLRSFDKADGLRRMSDLLAMMRPVTMEDGTIRSKIYPGEDARAIRVVKKVIRGLSYFHNVLWPISDQRIWADVMRYVVPQNILQQMEYHHRERDVAEYRYHVVNEGEIHSAWLITFFQRVTFIGLVSVSETGFT